MALMSARTASPTLRSSVLSLPVVVITASLVPLAKGEHHSSAFTAPTVTASTVSHKRLRAEVFGAAPSARMGYDAFTSARATLPAARPSRCALSLVTMLPRR